MFFTSSLIFLKKEITIPPGNVKISNNRVIRSAKTYPSFSIQGLTAQKYSPPPSRQKMAPYSLTGPPQAFWDQKNSAPVAPTQNTRSRTGPRTGTLTRTRKTRNRSYATPMAAPRSSASHRACPC